MGLEPLHRLDQSLVCFRCVYLFTSLRIATPEAWRSMGLPLTPCCDKLSAAKSRMSRAIAEAQKIVAIWNARQAGGRALWFYPTIGGD
jgi:hypothetical protein